MAITDGLVHQREYNLAMKGGDFLLAEMVAERYLPKKPELLEQARAAGFEAAFGSKDYSTALEFARRLGKGELVAKAEDVIHEGNMTAWGLAYEASMNNGDYAGAIEFAAKMNDSSMMADAKKQLHLSEFNEAMDKGLYDTAQVIEGLKLNDDTLEEMAYEASLMKTYNELMMPETVVGAGLFAEHYFRQQPELARNAWNAAYERAMGGGDYSLADFIASEHLKDPEKAAASQKNYVEALAETYREEMANKLREKGEEISEGVKKALNHAAGSDLGKKVIGLYNTLREKSKK